MNGKLRSAIFAIFYWSDSTVVVHVKRMTVMGLRMGRSCTMHAFVLSKNNSTGRSNPFYMWYNVEECSVVKDFFWDEHYEESVDMWSSKGRNSGFICRGTYRILSWISNCCLCQVLTYIYIYIYIVPNIIYRLYLCFPQLEHAWLHACSSVGWWLFNLVWLKLF